MCCGWTFWFYQAFEFFFYFISFVQIFWFYPYICTVLYAPPPPPISLCSNCMCYSLFLELGGEMLIDLTFSLCSFTPPPPFPEHTWASLLSLIIPTPLSSDNTVVIFPLQTAFREHYANICTFLRTFSCSISLLFVCANFYQFFANIMQTLGHFCKHFRAAFNIAPCLGSICPSQYMWISSDDALQYVFLC
jgi:hypothetical protein